MTLLQQVTSERDLAVERFVLMCKAMNQCMWDWDMRTNVAWYSEANYSVFGLDPNATTDFESWTQCVHPDDRERVVAKFRDVVENGKSEWSDEYRFVRPDNGAVIDASDRGFVMLEDGRPVRMVGVVMDVTKQRALERQLRDAQKMQAIGQLAGGIAHDFNNMLQAAKLELELLRVTPGASPQVLAHAKQIGVTVDRAASLTRQLLMFSRLEAMRLRTIDLNASIGELKTMLERLLGENIALELQLASDGIPVEADSSMLDQVLVNLAVNGRDAMTSGGSLSITTSRCGHMVPASSPPGRYVCLEVRDTGAGIAKDILPRVFDPFFTTKENGTGLGLATVYGIVEQHRGWVTVESELERGTTFRIYLPEHDRAAAVETRGPEQPAPSGHERILLVEDDVCVRTALSSVLASQGYQVLEAESATMALSIWEQTSPPIDLVVTDQMMPGMTGSELAAALTARQPNLAILIISGHMRAPASNDGATFEFLHKPFDADVLLARVRACLDRAATQLATQCHMDL